MGSLYILDINPLSHMWNCKYFLPFCRLHFNFPEHFFCCSEAFWIDGVTLVYLFFLRFYFYFWERERDRVRAGEGQREREQNPKQAPGSELSVQNPTWGLNPRTARSWPEPKSDAQLTEPPGCSYFCFVACHFGVITIKLLLFPCFECEYPDFSSQFIEEAVFSSFFIV